MPRTSRTRRAAEPRPLAGVRAVVTRAAGQAGELRNALEALGATTVAFPTLVLRAPADSRPLDRAIDRLALYDWLLFTSANGVRRFFERLERRGCDLRAVGHLRLAAIGPGTAETLAEYRLRADVVPPRYVAESLAAALAKVGVRGARILLPRAREAREALPVLLARHGAAVDVVEAYRMEPVRYPAARVRRLLLDRPCDLLTFLSAQTAKFFAAAVGVRVLRTLRGTAAVASIGPITTRALREIGLPPHAQARPYDLDGLVAAAVRAVRVGRRRRR